MSWGGETVEDVSGELKRSENGRFLTRRWRLEKKPRIRDRGFKDRLTTIPPRQFIAGNVEAMGRNPARLRKSLGGIHQGKKAESSGLNAHQLKRVKSSQRGTPKVGPGAEGTLFWGGHRTRACNSEGVWKGSTRPGGFTARKNNDGRGSEQRNEKKLW